MPRSERRFRTTPRMTRRPPKKLSYSPKPLKIATLVAMKTSMTAVVVCVSLLGCSTFRTVQDNPGVQAAETAGISIGGTLATGSPIFAYVAPIAVNGLTAPGGRFESDVRHRKRRRRRTADREHRRRRRPEFHRKDRRYRARQRLRQGHGEPGRPPDARRREYRDPRARRRPHHRRLLAENLRQIPQSSPRLLRSAPKIRAASWPARQGRQPVAAAMPKASKLVADG